jgi:hypothetical protein
MEEKTAQEITIEVMKSLGIKVHKLICGKYTGVGLVLDTGYKYYEGSSASDYDADHPGGFNTGQWIIVQVTEGIMSSYPKGITTNRVWSYGGDTVIIGKPKIGNIVGFYWGFYAQIWEKLAPNQKLYWAKPGKSKDPAQQKY